MRSAALALLGALALAHPAPARACGHCPTDKIAAVYDYALEKASLAAGNGVAYLDITRGFDGTPEAARAVEKVLAGIKGVLPDSIRVSVNPVAARFAFDGHHRTADEYVDEANRRLLRARGWGLVLLKAQCEARPAPAKPAAVPRRAARAR